MYQKESTFTDKNEKEKETDRSNNVDGTNDDLMMLKSMLDPSKD